MKSISLWAYHHKWSARFILVLCFVVLNIIGFIAGDLLFAAGVQVSAFLVYLFTAAYMVAFVLYPSRKEKHRYRNYYGFQKTCDGILVTASFLLIISAANLREVRNSPFRFATAQAVVPVSVPSSNTVTLEKSGKKQSLVKKLQRSLSKAVQSVRQYWKSRSTAEKAVLIFLAVVLAVAALFGVLGIACNLSCAGSDAAALIVGVLGSALVIFLFARALRGINRSYRKEKPKPQPPASS